MSIAAAGACDHTIVVTEADTVTFAGTLGLIDSYCDQYSSAERKPKIEYVVNRVPPRYAWRDLDRLYQKHLGLDLGRLGETDSILSYIPTVGYVADSFGDYPFQVELVPTGLFTRKLELLLHSLLQGPCPQLLSKSIRDRFCSARRRRRTRRRLISDEVKRVRTAFASYAVFSVCVSLLLAAGGVWLLVDLYAEGLSDSYRDIVEAIVLPLLVAVGALAVPAIIYLLVGLARIVLYFREKLGFEKAFARVLSRKGASWRSVKVWKLRALFWGSLCVPALCVVLPATMMPSLGRGRASAQQAAACMDNLHNIGLAMAMCMYDNNEQMPESLSDLVADGYLSSNEVLLCPADSKPVATGDGLKSSYRYVGPLPRRADRMVITVYDKAGNHRDGRNALFVDVHIEFLSEPDFQHYRQDSLEMLKQDGWMDLTPQRQKEIEAVYTGDFAE